MIIENRNWRLVKFSDVMHGKHDPARLGLVQAGQGRHAEAGSQPLRKERCAAERTAEYETLATIREKGRASCLWALG